MRRSLLLPCLLLAAIAVGVLLVGPVWGSPTGSAPATRFTDGHLLGISLWAAPLRDLELPSLFTPVVGWPHGADLRPLLWPTAGLGAVLGAPLALNLTFALVPAFNLLCGWILGAALGREPAGRAVLGGLLALHPWVIETLVNGQVEQAVIGGAALQIAASIWAMEGRFWRLSAPAAVTALVGWAAPHVALSGCVLAGLWAAARLFRREARALVVIGSIGSIGLGAAAVQAYHAPSFGPQQHVFAPKGSDGRPTALADLPEFATPQSLVEPPGRSTAPVVHPRYLGLVLLAAALWGARRERGALAAAGLLVVLALGEAVTIAGVRVPLPWAALPMLSSSVARSMSAYRMIGGAVVALAVAASGTPRWWIIVLAWVEAVAVSTRALPISAAVVHADSSRAELASWTGAVLDLPLAGPTCPGGTAHYLIEAANTGRPVPLLLTNPRAGYSAVRGMVQDLARGWGREDCAERLGENVRRWGFSAVVLHQHDPDCPVPAEMRRCVEGAFGEARGGEDVEWWELGGDP